MQTDKHVYIFLGKMLLGAISGTYWVYFFCDLYTTSDDLPDKSNPLFRHKDATDHTLHLSVMHIFYNIHIRPRIFPFLVYTVGDLSFVQLKRLLENRTVDMWLDI